MMNNGPHGVNSIYTGANYGPTFGGGHDIYISDNSNGNTSSYSNLGHGYTSANGYIYGSTQAQSLMAGSYSFQVTEIEVYTFSGTPINQKSMIHDNTKNYSASYSQDINPLLLNLKNYFQK